MWNKVRLSLCNRWVGQGLVEYALILFLIALVVVTSLTVMGTGLNDTYNTISGMFT